MNSDYPKKILNTLTLNGPEKQVVRLAFVLFILGVVMRYLPWGLPSIESFQVGDAVIVAAEDAQEAEKRAAQQSNLEYPPGSFFVEDKLITRSEGGGDLSHTRSKGQKGTAKAVKLPVHVNSASVEELCALKGVGPKLAEKIIAVREASGPFKTGADLQKVPGIGKKKLDGLLSGVIFD